MRRPLFFIWMGYTVSLLWASKPVQKLPKLAVLQPVDLKSGQVSSKLGADFRSIFKEQKKWHVIPTKAIKNKLQEYGKDINTPCKELGCAFEVGEILQAQYALYSTITIFENYFIFSFNLVDMSITKVVWSKNGEIPIKSGKNGDEALLHRLRQLAKNLGPDKIKNEFLVSKGTLGILNLSPDTDYSRILFERLSTHAYTSGLYDLVGQTEFEFILESINVKTSNLVPTEKKLIPLGQKLGVDYLIYCMLTREKSEFDLYLGIVDIKNKKMGRFWPNKSKSFRKTLHFEDTFFSNLIQSEKKIQHKPKPKKLPKWKKLAIPGLLVTAGAFGYITLSKHYSAERTNREFSKINSQNLEDIEKKKELKNKGEKEKRQKIIYGTIGGSLVLGCSIVLFAF